MRTVIAKIWKWYLLHRVPRELLDSKYVEIVESREGYEYWLRFTPKTLTDDMAEYQFMVAWSSNNWLQSTPESESFESTTLY